MQPRALLRLALPFWDVPAVTGDAAPAADTPPPTADPSDDSGGSLSDHEAEYGRAARRAEPAADPKPAIETSATERDEKTGQFKPRHRAKSQQASAEDAPRIAELTRLRREAERERDEWKARAEARASREEPAVDRRQPAPERFPKFEAWIQQAGNTEKDFDDWLDARDDHRRALDRAADARAADATRVSEAERAFAGKLDAAREKYPDFDDVVDGTTPVSMVLQRAILEVGPDAAYWLATHDKEREELTAESLVHPNNPAFGAAVAGMRRYLRTLVASEQRSSPPSRMAAGSTGAAPASVPKPAPKPPTPVRTSALRDADAPPGDDDGLAAHERAYGPKRRRA